MSQIMTKRCCRVLSVLMLFFFCSSSAAVDVPVEKGVIRAEALTDGIFRVRLSTNNRFENSILEKYGIVRTNFPDAEAKITQSQNKTLLETKSASLSIDRKTGTIALFTKENKPLVSGIRLYNEEQEHLQDRVRWLIDYFRMYEGQTDEQVLYLTNPGEQSGILGEPEHVSGNANKNPKKTIQKKPFGAIVTIGEDEKFYGLGAASTKRIQHRGHAYRNWAEYKNKNGYDQDFAKFEQTEGPNPFLMSSAGWGVYLNSPALNFFDVGTFKNNELFLWGPQGEADLYLFVAENMQGILDKYTQLTGKPRLLPIWGYGLTYVGNIVQNQHESLHDALQFRQNDIPCDIFGLEPQWMKKFYDYSHEKQWDNHGRFSVFEWMGKDATMIGAMERMGFKLSLWLCVDDDLTVEEERQIAQAKGELDQFPPDAAQGWFEHLKKFVDQGVAAFKIDPSRIIETHFGREYYNGQSDLQMHNLTQTLMHKQMQQGFEEYTHHRAMVHFCGSYTGVQHFGASTMGDNGGGPKALVWMLGHGLAGHSNTSCDMWTGGASGIHFGFLMPWSQHNNWAGCQQPWYLGKEGLESFQTYAKLRYRLIPYIYSSAHVAYQTGLPIMRAMPLVYDEDPECENLTNQYMLGDFLLISAFSNECYLPQGKWIDYWTGEVYVGPQKVKQPYDKIIGGALFIKCGAVVPMWPEIDHISEKQFETIRLDVYPYNESAFTLYEDDGITLDYQKGKIAKSRIVCSENDTQTTLRIFPREGTYDNMPKMRYYDIAFHVAHPKSVHIDNRMLTKESLRYDVEHSILHIKVQESDNDQPVSVVLSK